MPQGKAIDLRERELVVRLKEHFDEEKFRGPTVSTMDLAGRVAEALGLSKCAVKKIVSDYRRTGEVASAKLASRGRPPYRIQSALETVIRHEIRRHNREGSHVSLGTLSNWLDEHYEKIPTATLGRALGRMGFLFGRSRRKSALRERDDVLIARRTYRSPSPAGVSQHVHHDEAVPRTGLARCANGDSVL
jgi:transposase